jgi:hypothetical protein
VDQVEVVANVKAAEAFIKSNNKLYYEGASNFLSRFYWFNALTRAQMLALFGAIPPPKPQAAPELPLYTLDGRKYEAPLKRRKRANNPPLPECQNLPSYKNWVEEGKTAPVQDQKSCGV